MTEYISKQVQINRSDQEIFEILADFEHFTPIVKDRVEGWEATQTHCSFKIHGVRVALVMEEREPFKTIKLTGDQMPFEFYFWVQLKSVAESDTRLRITVKAKLNPMMKLMLGSKLQKGIDNLADQIATAFNSGMSL